MTRRLTDGQRAARRELCALARTALDVCDVAAAKGAEDDDRPRAWLLSMERWARGEETGARLAVATNALRVWCVSSCVTPPPAVVEWARACSALDDAREDAAKHPTHITQHSQYVARSLVTALRLLTGDAEDAARAQVAEWRRRHREAIAREETERERAALTAKLKDDKAAAELVLGTAQETGR